MAMADDRFVPEELLLNSIPARQTVLLHGWAVRLNADYTYRANCVCPLCWDAAEDVPQKITQCEELFRRQGMSAVFKVTPLLQDGFAEILTRMGYETIKTVNVMTGRVPESIPPSPPCFVCRGRPDEAWLAASAGLSGISDGKLLSVRREGMRNIPVRGFFVRSEMDGKTVGCAYGTEERGFVGIYDLHVAPEYRRRGIGTAVCNAILAFGRRNGAHTAYLIVHSRNRNAIALYERMGFRKSYEYSFFGKPGGTGITDA
jgi:ribosomal protein S18 acetylase RimI-like enzyme